MRELAGAFVLAGAISAVASGQDESNPRSFKPVLLNVVATDHAGRPVTDLKPGGLRVVDNDAEQQQFTGESKITF